MTARKTAASFSILLLLAGAPAFADHCCGGGGGGEDREQPAPAAKATTFGPHGGVVTSAADASFEVVFERDRVTLHRLGAEPADGARMTAQVAVEFTGVKRRPVRAKLRRARGKECFEAKLDLRRVPEGGATAAFRVEGAPGEATFEVTFALARRVEFACPMSCEEPHAEAGTCGKCKMDLVKKTFIYACSMHPAVTAREPKARCWECGMALTRVDAPATDGQAGPSGN